MLSPRSYFSPRSTEQDAKTQESLALVSASLLLVLLNSLALVSNRSRSTSAPLSLLEPVEGICSNFALNLSVRNWTETVPPSGNCLNPIGQQKDGLMHLLQHPLSEEVNKRAPQAPKASSLKPPSRLDKNTRQGKHEGFFTSSHSGHSRQRASPPFQACCVSDSSPPLLFLSDIRARARRGQNTMLISHLGPLCVYRHPEPNHQKPEVPALPVMPVLQVQPGVPPLPSLESLLHPANPLPADLSPYTHEQAQVFLRENGIATLNLRRHLNLLPPTESEEEVRNINTRLEEIFEENRRLNEHFREPRVQPSQGGGAH